jgi:hypothetical protein
MIRDSQGESAPSAVIPTVPAQQRVISVREGPALSMIVLPPAVTGSDPSLVTIGEPGRLLDLGQGDPPGVLPTYNDNSFGNNGPFS